MLTFRTRNHNNFVLNFLGIFPHRVLIHINVFKLVNLALKSNTCVGAKMNTSDFFFVPCALLSFYVSTSLLWTIKPAVVPVFSVDDR